MKHWEWKTCLNIIMKVLLTLWSLESTWRISKAPDHTSRNSMVTDLRAGGQGWRFSLSLSARGCRTDFQQKPSHTHWHALYPAWQHLVFLSSADLGGQILTPAKLQTYPNISPWGWSVCVCVCGHAHGYLLSVTFASWHSGDMWAGDCMAMASSSGCAFIH